MRLFEIVSPRFFLVTSTKQVLQGHASVQGTVCPLGAAIEGRLEATRPDSSLSRASSLYLHRVQPSAGEYVYEVEVGSQLDRHHTAWLGRLQEVSLDSQGAVDQLCRAYWSGQECPEERDLPWEYRALQAIIIRRVGGVALKGTA